MAYANVNRLNGFVPLDNSGRLAAIVKPRPIPLVRQTSDGGNASTDMAVGDAYSLDGNGNAYRAGPNDLVIGILWGWRVQAVPTVMNGQGPISIEYVTGAMTATLLGIEDAGVLFAVYANTFSEINVGGKFNLLDAAPDSLFRVSQQTLNVSGGAGVQFQLQDIVQSPADNAVGANARVAVRLLQTFNS